jgi:hypothetical protein
MFRLIWTQRAHSLRTVQPVATQQSNTAVRTLFPGEFGSIPEKDMCGCTNRKKPADSFISGVEFKQLASDADPVCIY